MFAMKGEINESGQLTSEKFIEFFSSSCCLMHRSLKFEVNVCVYCEC